MSGSLGLSAIKTIEDNIYRAAATTITASGGLLNVNGDIPLGNRFFVEVSGADITIDLPPASDFPGDEIFIKRRTNGPNVVSIVPDGADNFEDAPSFLLVTLATKSEFVRLKANASGYWEIIGRYTFGVGALNLSAPTTYDVAITPTKIDVFDVIDATNTGRIDASTASNEIVINQLEDVTVGDPFDIRFGIDLNYDNTRTVTAQVYCDGVPIPGALASNVGRGAANTISLTSSIFVLEKTTCTLDVRITGEVVSAAVPIQAAVFQVRMAKG